MPQCLFGVFTLEDIKTDKKKTKTSEKVFNDHHTDRKSRLRPKITKTKLCDNIRLMYCLHYKSYKIFLYWGYIEFEDYYEFSDDSENAI